MTWPSKPLAQIARQMGGGTPSRKEPSFWGPGTPWFTVADMTDEIRVHSLSTSRESITAVGLKASAANAVPAGSVVFSTRVVVGKIGITQQTIATNQDFVAFIPDLTTIDADFLAWYLLSKRWNLRSRQKGATIQGIRRSDLDSLPIPVPPLPEQRRIVARIQEMMERVDEVRRLRDETKRQSVALSTSARKEAYDIPDPLVALGSLILDGPTNGLYKPASTYGTGTPILRINNFDNGDKLRGGANLKRLTLTPDEARRYALRENDFVINRVNGSLDVVGKACLIERLDEPTVFESNMMCFAIDDRVASRSYVLHFLASPQCRWQIKGKAKHIQQASINQQDVKSLRLPLPPLPEQGRIAATLDHICEHAQRLKAQIDEGTSSLGALPSAILRKAFAGEL